MDRIKRFNKQKSNCYQKKNVLLKKVAFQVYRTTLAQKLISDLSQIEFICDS